MAFVWFSYGVPIVSVWFSCGFPMVFLGFPLVFVWLSYGFSLAVLCFFCFSYCFPSFSYGFPMVVLGFPCFPFRVFLGLPMVFFAFPPLFLWLSFPICGLESQYTHAEAWNIVPQSILWETLLSSRVGTKKRNPPLKNITPSLHPCMPEKTHRLETWCLRAYVEIPSFFQAGGCGGAAAPPQKNNTLSLYPRIPE